MTDASRDHICLRGARQNNLKNLDLDIPLNELIVVTGRVRLGQVLAGVRHALRRRPAPLRRDLLALRAAVPRPHGQAAGRLHRRHPAGDRHRPDQPGAHLALHRRHDDRAQRSPEAAVRARRQRCTASAAASRCASDSAREHLRGPERARARGRQTRACCITLSRAGAGELHHRGGARAARAPGLHALLRRAARERARTASRAVRGKKRGRAAAAAPTVTLEVVQDRLRAGSAERGRVLESLEAALRVGRGRVNVQLVDDGRSAAAPGHLALLERAALRGVRPRLPGARRRASSPSTPRSGACETCRGFGRTIGIDYGLVIPDENKTLRAGAIKPWQTKSYKECQEDLEKFAKTARHPARYALARAAAPRRATG